jgi:putative spermidine/putrescine transport system permease protein
MVFWISTGYYGHIIATIISHGIFLVTLPLVTISLGLESMDRQLLEAARTMGADRRKLFFTVILPLIRPYIISGFSFAFVLSLNEYIIAYMVAGFTAETLPIKIFNSLRYGYTPVMAAVAVFFVVLAITVFGLVARFGDLPRLLGSERVSEH